MFIICPKCGAKYQIPEGTTLENGQKLKCSACGHLFLKGEESPLILEQVATPATPTETAPKAFSKPLYTMDDSPEQPATPIPEVFQPLPESAPKKSGLWIIPIYMILLVVLCIAGWKFRDLLKPSFSDMMPAPEKPAPTLPVIQGKITPQPVVIPEPKQPHVPIPPQPFEPKPIVAPTPLPPTPQPLPESKPVPTPKVEPATELPLPPEETDVEPLPDDGEPLFEITAPVVPVATRVQDVSYKIEPNEEGVSQLLVNGNLQNLTDEIQSVPVLTLFVYDAQDQLLAQKEIHLTTDILAPTEVLPFYTSLTPAPATTARVEVRP